MGTIGIPPSRATLDALLEGTDLSDPTSELRAFYQLDPEMAALMVGSGMLSVRTQLDALTRDVHARALARWSSAVEVQEVLADHHLTEVRFTLTSNWHLNREVSVTLATDEDVMVRNSLAQNKRAHLDALVLLLEDTNSVNRATAASTLVTHGPPGTWDALATSRHFDVRLVLADDLEISPLHAALLANDPVAQVSFAAVENSAVTITDEFLVPALRRSARGVEHMRHQLEHFDPDAVNALMPTFGGTLETLKLVLEECSTPTA